MARDPNLQAILHTVEPAVRLVPERHLRKVLNYLIDWGRPLPTNTKLPVWVSRADLEAADVLSKHVMAGSEPMLLLITEPDDRLIDQLPKAEQLRAYWRVLFQAAVMREIDWKLETGALTVAACGDRLNRFGQVVAREIRYVLEAEHLADPEADNAGVFRIFAAVYLDEAIFAREQIDDLFPSLPYREAVTRALAADLDVVNLLARSRPGGAADPEPQPEPDQVWIAEESNPTPPIPATEIGGLLGQAREAEQKENHVRAAILHRQIALKESGERRGPALAGAALGKLVDALGDMFHWDNETRQEWRQALAPLLDLAAGGVWPRAARCLYELQKIPADLARDVYAVEMAETIRTLGRRPLKRPLPHAQPVLILMGLKKAHAQLLRAKLGHLPQLRLDRLFHHQIHILEHNVRGEFTPIIIDALSRAGLCPTNTVEVVGRDKLIAELLDRVCEHGYLRIGDLRDAIARNRLKMADLAAPRDFFAGDTLLRADINLSYALDGVYRKGEFYLRWIQRFSALFFGTKWGRLFTLYLALPFGGSFIALMALEHLQHKGADLIAAVRKATPAQPPQEPPPVQVETPPPDAQEEPVPEQEPDEKKGDEPHDGPLFNPGHHIDFAKEVFTPSIEKHKKGQHPKTFLVAWPTIVGFGVFLLLMFHVPSFRRNVFLVLRSSWRIVRAVLWDIPMGVWRSPAVRGFRQSRPVRFLFRHFWSPLIITALVFGLMFLLGATSRFFLQWGWAIWAGLTLTYNFLGVGWVIQDRIAEALSDWWRVFRVNLLPNLLVWIFDLFRRLGNWIERKLYAVDEWLRYRGGDSQSSLTVKAILGLVWFPIAYIFRFAFYLLVEPQINPIKHFPVVTVSHKVLLPLVPKFGEFIVTQTGFGIAKANFWAFWIIAGIPGIFGFMAWEFLANWRLYRANRPIRLRPVMLGSHGETMRGLLRPGFHSGTVPKLFRKLRHAKPAKIDRFHHDLEHTAEGVHRFVDRELVDLLHHSPDWGKIRIHVEAVKLGCQQLTLELAAPTIGRDVFTLTFENIGGRIQATVARMGWADKLTESRRAAFVAALRGLLEMATVEFVDGHERTDDVPKTGTFADLARRMSWAEWIALWSKCMTEQQIDVVVNTE